MTRIKNVICDPQGHPLYHTARLILAHAWAAAGFKTAEQRQQAWAEGYRFTRLEVPRS